MDRADGVVCRAQGRETGRLYTYRRRKDLLGTRLTPARLVAFHTAHKLLLLAHDPKRYYEMGPMVAEAGTRSLDELEASEKSELVAVIDQYRRGFVPLVTALTQLGHHLRKIDHPWVEQHVYLDPYPRELALRSHV